MKQIVYEEVVETLKKTLGKDGEPLDEVPTVEIFNHIRKRLQDAQTAEVHLLDGFPYSLDELHRFIGIVGVPTFVVGLVVAKETIVGRVKAQKELPPTDPLPEEDQEALERNIERLAGLAAALENVSKTSFGMQYYTVDANVTMSTLTKSLDFVFGKRVLLLRDRSAEKLGKDAYNLFASICLRNGIVPVHVESLLKRRLRAVLQGNSTDELGLALLNEAQMAQLTQDGLLEVTSRPHYRLSPSLFHPRLVCRVILEHLRQMKYETNFVLLYGYPCADVPGNVDQALTLNLHGQLLFPRPLDELVAIEELLGEVKLLASVDVSKQYTEIHDPIEELPPEPKKEIEALGDGDDPKDAQPKDADDDENKPKFNPRDFQWSRIDVAPKTLPQVFTKLKTAEKVATRVNLHDAPQVEAKILEILSRIGETDENILAELLI
eukprot:TRINITY_DN3344_c0_g2_i1.p1 TRINITY_DN3344_c0_g2~~TRINITY_DN3344_c0_g2_i1.p1  ORF type:complete len:436 (-),score=146.76 TRINITY_DN3344_c0_g2_i1:128-1435(-)